MDPWIWLVFVAASIVLLPVPGPTVSLVGSRAIGHGLRMAVPRALGVAGGDLLTMSLSLSGLGALVMASNGDAATVTMANLGSISFLIAFVPQFPTVAEPLAPQFAFITVTFVALATLNAPTIAILAPRLRDMIRRYRAIDWLTRAGGGAPIASGALSATLRHAPA